MRDFLKRQRGPTAACFGLLLSLFSSLSYADQTGNTSGLPSSVRVDRLPPASASLQTTEQLAAWLAQHQQYLGMRGDSQVSLKLQAAPNGYQIATLQQQHAGIDIALHRSTLILRDGQPQQLFAVTTDVPAAVFPRPEQAASLLTQALATQQLSVGKQSVVTPVYWREAEQLTPAWLLQFDLQRQQQRHPYDVYLSTDGRLLAELPRDFDIRYKLIDVDSMCRSMGVNFDIGMGDLINLIIDFEYSYPLPTRAADAPTQKSRQLAEMIDDGRRFLNDVLGQLNLDPADQVTLYALVGDNYYESLNCGGNYNTNATFQNLSDTLAITQVHTPILQNPEVILHELAHGIIAYSSGLIYQGESGALNEAYSDAIGVSFVAWSQRRMQAPARRDWEMWLGRQMLLRDFAAPQRGMAAPPVIPEVPDHYSIRYVGTEDYGGVHYNSSIINHMFYLLSEGGQHRRLGGVEVPKIGMEKALALWHFAATRILTANATFEDTRFAFAAAAEILYGEYGMERTAVHKAFDAVGIKGSWIEKVPPPKVEVPLPDPQQDPTLPKTPQVELDPPDPEVPKQDPSQPPTTLLTFNLDQLALVIGGLLVLSLFAWLVARAKPGKVPRAGAYQPYQYQRNAAAMPVSMPVAQRERGKIIGYLHAKGERFPLFSENLAVGLTIGRSSQADISLAHPSVSSFHAKLKGSADYCVIEDLGSSYGTRVNGQALVAHQPQRIRWPLKIQLADLVVQLSTDSEPVAGRAAAAQPAATPPSKANSLTLRINGQCYHLAHEQAASRGYQLGRHTDNDLVIQHASVSGRHAKVTYAEQQWWFEDLGSSYGSKLATEQGLVTVSAHQRYALKNVRAVYLSDCKIEIEQGASSGTIVL